MSLSEKQIIERISEVDFEQRPNAGWQDAVRKQIRDEDQPAYLRLVELAPAEPRRDRPNFSLMFSGLALAAAVLLTFGIIQDQRRRGRIDERSQTIAMVVEFVELEKEMAEVLAEVNLTQARMDEAFRDLQSAQEEQALLEGEIRGIELPVDSLAPSPSPHQHEKRARTYKAKAKTKKDRVREQSNHDPLAGL